MNTKSTIQQLDSPHKAGCEVAAGHPPAPPNDKPPAPPGSEPEPEPNESSKPDGLPVTDGNPSEEAGEAKVDDTPDATPDTPLMVGGIDLDSIALDDDYSEGMEGEDEGMAAVPIRKASRDWFIRTHPTAWKNLRLLEIKDGADRGHYLVHRGLWKLCQADDIPLRPVRLTLATSRESGAFLWPLKLQEKGCDNRRDEWSASALRIAKLAEAQWVKIFTKPGGNCYSSKVADGIQVPPVWPNMAFEEILALAFEGKTITDANDPLFRRIRGKE
jgi:hypothetical protein